MSRVRASLSLPPPSPRLSGVHLPSSCICNCPLPPGSPDKQGKALLGGEPVACGRRTSEALAGEDTRARAAGVRRGKGSFQTLARPRTPTSIHTTPFPARGTGWPSRSCLDDPHTQRRPQALSPRPQGQERRPALCPWGPVKAKSRPQPRDGGG